MRVAFIGTVGSGKSTQAQRLSWTMPFYNRCPRLSTGDLVQAQIEARTPIGTQIEGYYRAGEPVPDGIVMDMLVPHVRTAGGSPWTTFRPTRRRTRSWTTSSRGAARALCTT